MSNYDGQVTVARRGKKSFITHYFIIGPSNYSIGSSVIHIISDTLPLRTCEGMRMEGVEGGEVIFTLLKLN